MKTLIVSLALLSFVAGSMLPYVAQAQAQTPAGGVKFVGASKKAKKHKIAKRVQLPPPAPAAPALMERMDPRMGM
jgi:hypothetical protein